MTLLRIFPYASIQFTAYERYKQIANAYLAANLQITGFLCGAFAGTTAVTCTYPFDIVRTRLIYSLHNNNQQRESKKINHSIREVIKVFI